MSTPPKPRPTIQFTSPPPGKVAVDTKISLALSRSEAAGLLGASATIESPAFGAGKTHTVRFGPRSSSTTVKVRLTHVGVDQTMRISRTDSGSAAAPGSELKVTVAKPALVIESATSGDPLTGLKLGGKVKVTVKRDLVIQARGSTFRLESGAFAAGKTYPGEIRRGQDTAVIEVTLDKVFDGAIELKPATPADTYSEIGAPRSQAIKVLAPELSFKSASPGTKNVGDEVTLGVRRSYEAPFSSKAVLESTAFDDGKTWPVEIPAGKQSVDVKVKLTGADTSEQKILLKNPEAPAKLGSPAELKVTVQPPQVAFEGAVTHADGSLTQGKFWIGLDGNLSPGAKIKVVLDAPAPKKGAKARLTAGPTSMDVSLKPGEKEKIVTLSLTRDGKMDLQIAAVSGCRNHAEATRLKRDVDVRKQPVLTLTRNDNKTTPFRVKEDDIVLKAVLSDEAPLGGARVKVGCPGLDIPAQLVEFKAGMKVSDPATFTIKAGKAGIDQKIEMSELRGLKPPTGELSITALPVGALHKDYALRPARTPVEFTFGEKARVTVVLNAPAGAGDAKLHLECDKFDDQHTDQGHVYEITCKQNESRVEKVVKFKDPTGTNPEDFTILLKENNDASGQPQRCLVSEAANAKETKGKLLPLPEVKFATPWISPSDPQYAGDAATVKIELERSAPAPDGATFTLKSASFASDYPVAVKAGEKTAQVQIEWATGHAMNKAAVDIIVDPAADKGCRVGPASNSHREHQVLLAPRIEFGTGGTLARDTQHPKDHPGSVKVRLLNDQGAAVQAPDKVLFKIQSTAFGAKVYRGAIAKGATEVLVDVALAVGHPENPPGTPPPWQRIIVEPVSGATAGPDEDGKRFIRVRVKDDQATAPTNVMPCQQGAKQGDPEVPPPAAKPCNQQRLLLAELHGDDKVGPERGESTRGIFEFLTGSRANAKYADAFLSGRGIEVIAGGTKPAGHPAHITWFEIRGDDLDPRCDEQHVLKGLAAAETLLKHPHILVSYSDGQGKGDSQMFPGATWRTGPGGEDGSGPHSGYDNAKQKKALHAVRVHPPTQFWMDLLEKKVAGHGIPFASAIRAISVSKKLVRKRRYSVTTDTCGVPAPGTAGPTGKSFTGHIDVYPSDEFAITLSVRPVPAMHWGYTGRFIGSDGQLQDPAGGAGGDTSIKGYDEGEDFGADLMAGGNVGTVGGAAAFGDAQDLDSWKKQYEEGASDREQATIGDIGEGDPYRTATTLNDRGLVFLNTFKEKESGLFVEDKDVVAFQKKREVRQKRKASLSFHAGSDSEHPQTWEDANKMVGTAATGAGQDDIQANWSEFYGEGSEGKVWLAPAQVRDRFNVSLTHNGKEDPSWDTIATTLNTIISTISHVGEMFTQLQDMVPSYGLGFQLSMGFLEGDLTYRWGWKEHTDHRVFLWKELAAEVMLFRLSVRVDFGARWRFLFVQFEAIVYAQITGQLGLAGYWQIDQPDGSLGLEESSLSAPCKAEAGVNVVLVHEHILRVNGAIKTGLEFKFRFTFEEEFRTEYERAFMGLSVSATFKLIGFAEQKAEKYLIEGDPPGAPAVRKLLFPRSQVGGYWDIRSNMALLWKKLGIEYAKLQGAMDAWHALQMEILRKRDPLDVDPRGWPYTSNPGLKEVDFSIPNPQSALTESQDWKDQWDVFKAALASSQGDWITVADAAGVRTDKKVQKRAGVVKGRRVTDTLRGRLQHHINAMDQLVVSGVTTAPVPHGWRRARVDLGLRDVMVGFHRDYFEELRKLDVELNLKEDDDPGLPTDKASRNGVIEKRRAELKPIRTKLANYTKAWMPLRVKPVNPLSAREKTRQLIRAMDAGMAAIRHYHETYITTWKRP